MKTIHIRNIHAISVQPRRHPLVIVKVETDEPGLYGWGCATFTQRFQLVAAAVEEYLKPLLVGRDVSKIEDIWQLCMNSSYWRNGPVLNNAVSGIDEALWDIKGKAAGMPVYQLLGGKVRGGVKAYGFAEGDTLGELRDDVRRRIEEGYRAVRVQLSSGWDDPKKCRNPVWTKDMSESVLVDAGAMIRGAKERFQFLRETFGDDLGLIYDIHEGLAPSDALKLIQALEPYNPFYVEDAVAPEQAGWLDRIRMQSSVPLSMGELFTDQNDWLPLIAGRKIDYIRCHLSMIGGLTPARKLAAVCEAFGVRTSWHGPFDLSPVGMAAQLHLDFVIPNLGIQEFYGYTKEEQEIFRGVPVLENGYLQIGDVPGLGVEVDEAAAAAYPAKADDTRWTHTRFEDGTLTRP